MDSKLQRMLVLFLTIVTVLVTASTGQATLYDRGGGLIYDDYHDITWLQDANYARTSGYDDNGKMNWYEAMEWSENFVFQGYNDWRLPTLIPPYYGFGWTETEMGHLYYIDLGGRDSELPESWEPFINMLPVRGTVIYWSCINLGPDDAWGFCFSSNPGLQDSWSKDMLFFAWAVRDGDSTPVPLPASVWLLVSGLAGLGFLKRKGIDKIRSLNLELRR